MIAFGRLVTALSVCALLSSTASAQEAAPLLWEIEGETPSYLFGSFSHAFESTSELHPAVVEKLGGVDEILEEVKPDQQAVQQFLFLEDGKTLKDCLSEDVYAAVQKRLASKGVNIAQLARFRPWVVGVQLTQMEFSQEMQKQIGQSFTLAKLTNGKPRTGLLTFPEATGAFTSAPLEDQAQIVKDVLGKLAEWDAAGVKPNTEWAAAYLTGDVEEIQKIWVKDMSGENEELNARLIKAMYEDYTGMLAERIAEKLKAGGKSYGITLNCQLFGGPHNLIKKLEEQGLKLKRIGG